jgi:hypothetical protein
VFASVGFGFGGLDVVSTSQVARENHSTAKARTPSLKHQQKRKMAAAFTPTPSTLPLITPPGNGTGTACPPGEKHQGPSPVDYDLELDAEFPSEMITEMQEGAARKA